MAKVNAARNITFDGFEITNDPERDPYILFYVQKDWRDPDGEPSGIRVLRCWVHWG